MMNAKQQTLKLRKPAILTNEYGEQPIDHAPKVILANGNSAIPQQFLRTYHTRKTLEAIILNVNTPEGFLIFVGERNQELFLQVGIIGCENYPKSSAEQTLASGESSRKIVYGRRWLIERTAPTSEVIQTANLAVKKAREHELREKVFLRTKDESTATPFNCHIDLPLMASNPDLFLSEEKQNDLSLLELLQRVSVSELNVDLIRTPIELDGGYIVSLVLSISEDKEERHFPELVDQRVQLFVENLGSSSVLHELMAKLITLSEQYVDSTFSFNGFKRFERSINPLDIADFSVSTRRLKAFSEKLSKSHGDLSYEIDAKRVPPFSDGALGARQRRRVLSERNLCGHLPHHE